MGILTGEIVHSTKSDLPKETRKAISLHNACLTDAIDPRGQAMVIAAKVESARSCLP